MRAVFFAALAIVLVAPATNAETTILARPNYAPFTDQSWPQYGMISEIVINALAQNPDPLEAAVRWGRDPIADLKMLSEADVDLGMAWFQPDCAGRGHDSPRCVQFHFSHPIAEVVILLFVRATDPFAHNSDSDLEGLTICRPAGFAIDDLDGENRRLLSTDKVTFIQPADTATCFDLLMQGSVDAVAVNEFLGVQHLFAQQLTESVVPLPKALSRQTLHLVISKSHWRATALLYRFNAGLALLRETGQYAEIVDRHIALFWDRVKTQ